MGRYGKKYNVASVDDGYLLLAGGIVKRELDYYNNLLCKYSKYPTERKKLKIQIQNIEKNICANYFYILTMGAIDFPEYIKYLHKKYEISWEENVK